jgi:hypothetical protein
MDELLDSDTGYVRLPLPNWVSLLTPSWILEVRLHVENYVKEDLEYGSHSKIKKIGGWPNVGDVLRAEFNAYRGRVMVSRKPPFTPLALPLTIEQSVPTKLWPTRSARRSSGE